MWTTLTAALLFLGKMPSQEPPRIPLPGGRFGAGWGVNIHFTDEAPGEMGLIRSGGFQMIRMDFAWSGIERKKGEYDFSAFDRLLATCKQNKIRPLFILDYGNDLYGKDSPRTEEARAAFARFVSAALKRFKGNGILWDMWNEPNIFFWQPKPNVADYIKLAKAVGDVFDREAPNEWYIGPATSGFDWTFLEACFKAGLLKHFDAVTVHPYRREAPETVQADWARLRALIDHYAPGQKIPMISGEWGYSDVWEGFNQDLQARYLVRQYLANLAADIPVSIYYDWKNDGTDPKEPEHHFGTVKDDLTPKPAFLAAQRLFQRLAGFNFVAKIRRTDYSERGYLFRRGDNLMLVPEREPTYAWKLWDESSIKVQYPKVPPVIAVADRRQIVEFVKQVRKLGWQTTFRRSGKPLATDLSTWSPHAEGSIHAVLSQKGLKMALETEIISFRPLQVETIPGVGSQPASLSLRAIQGGTITGTVTVGKKVVPFNLSETRPSVQVPVAKGETIRVEADGPIPVDAVQWQPFAFGPGALTALAEGDAKVVADLDLSFANGERGPEHTLIYRFEPGWKFANLITKSPQFGKDAVRFGGFVFGDGSGHPLRLRFRDASGQTFQPEYRRIDWTGWRWVSVSLDGRGAGRWGGANDGVVRYPIQIESPFLVDSYAGAGGSGKVRFASPHVGLRR